MWLYEEGPLTSPASFFTDSLSEHALSVDCFYMDCRFLWYRQEWEIIRQQTKGSWKIGTVFEDSSEQTQKSSN